MLAAEDLALAEEAVPGGVASIEEAAGLEAKVALYPGRPILASQLRAPALVERNAVVRMSYGAGRSGSSPRAARSTAPRPASRSG